MNKFYEVTIMRCPNDSSMYQYLPPNGEGYDDAEQLLSVITTENHCVFELTDEIVNTVLPGHLQDIRGNIRDDIGILSRVFGIVHHNGVVSYFGIAEKEEN